MAYQRGSMAKINNRRAASLKNKSSRGVIASCSSAKQRRSVMAHQRHLGSKLAWRISISSIVNVIISAWRHQNRRREIIEMSENGEMASAAHQSIMA